MSVSVGAERAGVVLVVAPRSQQHVDDRASRRAGSAPKVSRVHSSAMCSRGEIRDSRPAGRSHRDWPSPDGGRARSVAADVGDADESARRAFETSCRRRVLHRRAGALRMHVEVEHLFPHRHEEHEVPLLAEILLRDLQLDRFVRLLERAEERRRRLADLEVDRSVLDLQHDVVVRTVRRGRGSCRRRRGRDRSSDCASPCGGRRRSRDRR